MESSGDMSHQCVCCDGLSSPAVTSLRCARPARDEDVQVILVGFQGDGNDGKCVPVAQWLEHCVSSAKVVGSIPREHTY